MALAVRKRLLSTLFAGLLADVTASSVRALPLQPGDLVVGGGSAGLYQIDPETRTKSLITSETFSDFAVGASGRLYGLSGNSVREIDPTTGTSSIVASGGLLADPMAISVGLDGRIYVLDFSGLQLGSLIEINPANGAQSLVSEGGFLDSPGSTSFSDISLMPGGGQVVIKRGYLATLLSVDLSTGSQTLLSRDFAIGSSDGGIGVGLDGSIFAVSFSQCECVGRFDPLTGSVESVFGMRRPVEGIPMPPGAGGVILRPRDVAVGFDGRLLVTGSIDPGEDILPIAGPLSVLAVVLPVSPHGPFGGFVEELAQGVAGEIEVVPIPEPDTAALVACGLAALSWSLSGNGSTTRSRWLRRA